MASIEDQKVCKASEVDCVERSLTAILLGGTGATGKEVLNELNSSDRISKIIFISRRAVKFQDMPKVYDKISVLFELQ